MKRAQHLFVVMEILILANNATMATQLAEMDVQLLVKRKHQFAEMV
jgi:hypothetical protein